MASANSGGITNGLSTLHFGPTNAAPTSWADAASPVTNFAGPIVLDLTNVSGPGLKGPDETLRVRDVFGPITVAVPPNPSYRIHIRAHTAFGPVSLANGGRGDGGMFTTKTADLGPAGGPTLTLELTDAFGPISVHPSP